MRARWRAAWQCPCHGDPGPRESDKAVEATATVIEKLVGDRPETCMWWAMRDPIVHEVLALYRAARTDSGVTPALLLSSDPPNRFWDGLLHYTAAIDRIRADDFRKAEAARAARESNR
jgi:hypothetical protein